MAQSWGSCKTVYGADEKMANQLQNMTCNAQGKVVTNVNGMSMNAPALEPYYSNYGNHMFSCKSCTTEDGSTLYLDDNGRGNGKCTFGEVGPMMMMCTPPPSKPSSSSK